MKNVKAGHTRPVVCLDAGHYGMYNQSPIVSEFYESEMNWKLQAFLKVALETYGIKVLTTRTDADADLPLTARGRAAADADAFLSLHANYSDNPEEDYVLGVHMVPNDTVISRQSAILASILSNAAGKAMHAEDVRIWTRASGSDRDGDGFKDDYYGVLRGAADAGTVGVILEHGFYTNEKQARWLLQDENLKILANAEAQALAQWFDVMELGNPYLLSLRSLVKGCKGPRVAAAQILLIGHGYPCGESGVDGSFGGATERAVKAYQEAHGLQVDGIIGGQTMLSLLGYR